MSFEAQAALLEKCCSGCPWSAFAARFGVLAAITGMRPKAAGIVACPRPSAKPNPHFSRPVRNAHSVPTSVGVSRESIRPGKLLPSSLRRVTLSQIL